MINYMERLWLINMVLRSYLEKKRWFKFTYLNLNDSLIWESIKCIFISEQDLKSVSHIKQMNISPEYNDIMCEINTLWCPIKVNSNTNELSAHFLLLPQDLLQVNRIKGIYRVNRWRVVMYWKQLFVTISNLIMSFNFGS